MLISNFYTIQQQETVAETAWTVDVALNPHHVLYNGHFPGNAVLPGVCTLQIIKECFEAIMSGSFRYVSVNSCKFLSAINPVENRVLRLHLSTKPLPDNGVQLIAEGKAGETEFIKLKATLLAQ